MSVYTDVIARNLGMFEPNDPENVTLADEVSGSDLFCASRPPKLTCRYCGCPVKAKALTDEDGNFFAWMPYAVCDEHKELQERDDRERKEQDARDKKKREWVSYEAAMESQIGGIGFHKPDWTYCTFDQYTPLTAMQKAALNMCRSYVGEFAQHAGNGIGDEYRDGRGLFIYGDNGLGKTHLLKAIGIAVMQAGYYGIIYRTDQAIIDDLNAVRTQRDVSERDCIDVFTNCRLLIIDDFGKETPTGYAVGRLFRILDERYQARRPTLISSNFSMEELEVRLASLYADNSDRARAIADRMIERMTQVHVDGQESYRARNARKGSK